MNIAISILLVIACIIALTLVFALFRRKEYNISCEIVIDAPLQKVFDYVRLLKNQDHFNKWVMVDPAMKRTFTGTDGTAGFIYGWNGNKQAGEGEQEIKSITEGKTVATEIRFVRPFVSVAHATMTTEPLSGTKTKVLWSNESKMKYPMNAMLPMVEKMLARDMNTSLNNLKVILEK